MTEINRTHIQNTFKKLAEHILTSYALSVPKNVCGHFMDLMFPLDLVTDSEIARKLRTVLFFLLGTSNPILDKELVKDLISIVPDTTQPEEDDTTTDRESFKIAPSDEFMLDEGFSDNEHVSNTDMKRLLTADHPLKRYVETDSEDYSTDSFLSSNSDSDKMDSPGVSMHSQKTLSTNGVLYHLLEEDGRAEEAGDNSRTRVRSIS